MSASRRLVIAFGAWLAWGSASAAALDTVDACTSQAASESKGVVALEVECPGLKAALSETGVIGILPEGWRDTLDADALRDLSALTHRYLDLPTQPAPDPARLRVILDQLAREQVKAPRSWWDSAKEWLRSWFADRDDSSAQWLERLVERLSRSVDLIKLITYVLLGIAVVATMVFVVNELRIAGVLSRRKQPGRFDDATVVSRHDKPGPVLADLDAAALLDQPGILLRLLVDRLLTNGALPAERNLTHRELVTSAAFPDAESRTRFARVSQLAERVLYGPGMANSAETSTVVLDGRKLLLQLQTPGSARQ
ncbi:MAG: hypothetical protein ABIQ86_12510 [Steroidobacteraceae bacterium]